MLEIKDLTLHYGAAQALKGISLTAEEGQITTVLGRNGVGKTSLMRAIVGRHPPSGGTITWMGESIAKLTPPERAKRGIAYVPQGREIFPLLTVRENLEAAYATLPRGARKTPDAVFELFPVLLQMMNRRGGDLSGGQQQQLAIGRALVLEPRLLILDEPTEGIQPNIVREIGDIIIRLNREQGLTVLLVEQKLPFARRVATDFRIIEKGRIVAADRIENLTDELTRRHLTV